MGLVECGFFALFCFFFMGLSYDVIHSRLYRCFLSCRRAFLLWFFLYEGFYDTVMW